MGQERSGSKLIYVKCDLSCTAWPSSNHASAGAPLLCGYLQVGSNCWQTYRSRLFELHQRGRKGALVTGQLSISIVLALFTSASLLRSIAVRQRRQKKKNMGGSSLRFISPERLTCAPTV